MSISPFATAAPALVQLGFSVLPLAAFDAILPAGKEGARGKAPATFVFNKWQLMRNWDDYKTRLVSDSELQFWMGFPNANIGLVLGPMSNLVALDFDYDFEGLHSKIQDLIEPSPVNKIGEKGYTAFYRYNGEKSTSWSYRPDGAARRETVLDLLSFGRQTVLPPSVHPITMQPYYWVDKGLHEVNIDDLPLLPTDFSDRVEDIFRVLNRKDDEPFEAKPKRIDSVTDFLDRRFNFKEPTPEKVLEALAFLDPDNHHNDWIEMGMAIKTEFGDAGFEIWDQWSSRGGKYHDKGNAGRMQTAWRSFKKSDKKIASIFYEAQRNGFLNIAEIELIERPITFLVAPGGNMERLLPNVPTPPAQPTIPNITILDDLPLSYDGDAPWRFEAPGLVGRIGKWILQTSNYPEPELALAATLAFAGAIKAHRVTLTNGLRTNIYSMGIAGSGQGKNHAREAIKVLLEKTEHTALIGGTPASSAGMFRSVADGHGRRLLLIDEFGKILKTFNAKGAGSHLATIPTLMMELFSSASFTYTGTEYSNPDQKRARQDIDQPCLCIYGTSTPDNVYQSMTSRDAVDGFLSRWLIWEAGEAQLYEQKNKASVKDPPQDLIDAILFWLSQKTNHDPKGNLDGVLKINPKPISFSAPAETLFRKFKIDMRYEMIKSAKKNNGFDAIYARTAEHASKIALVAFEKELIDQEIITWACDLAYQRSKYMCTAIAEHVSDNEHELEFKRVFRIISQTKEKGITMGALTRKTQFLRNAKRRFDIIGDLCDTLGQVIAIQIPGKTKPTVLYKAVDYTTPTELV